MKRRRRRRRRRSSSSKRLHTNQSETIITSEGEAHMSGGSNMHHTSGMGHRNLT